MADLYSVAGSKIYIGGVLASKSTDFVIGDYAGQTWVEIDGWETAGDVGDTAEAIKTALINRGRVIKQKGTSDAGTFECNFGLFPADAGQIALKAAQASQSNYAFKVAWAGGSTDYFIGLIMNKTHKGGNANTVQMLSATIEVNSNVVTV